MPAHLIGPQPRLPSKALPLITKDTHLPLGRLFSRYARATERRQAIGLCLNHYISVASAEQLLYFWPHGTTVKSVNRALADDEDVCSYRLTANAPPELLSPLVSMKVGEGLPANLSHISTYAFNRWPGRLQMLRVYVATRKGSKKYGGRHNERLKKRLQLSHDLLVSQLFFQCLAANLQKTLSSWVNGERLKLTGFCPDILIVSDQRLEAIVEIAGRYSAKRLTAVLRCAQRLKVACEIW